MNDRPIYLDHHATTPTDPRVLASMLPYFTEKFGNASSVANAYGDEAEEAVERARRQVAETLGAEAREIIFTSGATEANNLAIKGALPALAARGNHLVTAATEHRAVLDPLRRMSREGWNLTVVPAEETGRVTARAIAGALTDRTVLVSVMAANNEVGTLNPIREIGRLCRERRILFHTDATQAHGKIPLDVRELNVDLLSLSAHKIHGPKGVGALFLRRSQEGPPLRMTPQLDGGGHERGLRSGTLPVPLIVGLGEAAILSERERTVEVPRLSGLRDRLHEGLSRRIEGLILNGHPTERLPNNLNLSIEGVDGMALLAGLRSIAVSSGAACSSAEPGTSHVLLAMGRPEPLARASLRFGLGRGTTADEIDRAIEEVARVVLLLRGNTHQA